MKKNIYLLGATGSIGLQTLDVLRNNKERYELCTIAVGRNIAKAIEIIKEFNPKFVSVGSEQDAKELQTLFPNLMIDYGERGLIKAATFDPDNQYEHLVVTAVVGSVGLVPTVEAIKKGYNLAIANKETLVTAGHIIMDLKKKYGVTIMPIDSEHSALFQCLNGEDDRKIKDIIITASGGSFRDRTRKELEGVSVNEALSHPNWSMGSKITIDSATMMNKGLEVIEAHWLYNVPYDQIKTVLHRESIIHSMVEFVDTSIMAQMGTPDMRIPIQYALSYPERIELKNAQSLKIWELGTLNFEPLDFKRFPCLKYAYDAGRSGGTMPTVLNASNEAAVSLFLDEKINFLDIETIVYNEVNNHSLIKNPSLDEIKTVDYEIKEKIRNMTL